ncbi:MAG: hypothetical protein U5L45_13050 [Saprospiraceae bacterium]|nr:hypothetical protein [Saprospiraceae bacterium]
MEFEDFGEVYLKKRLLNYLVTRSVRSQKRGMWFVFRALPEKRTTSPPSSERSERVTK